MTVLCTGLHWTVLDCTLSHGLYCAPWAVYCVPSAVPCSTVPSIPPLQANLFPTLYTLPSPPATTLHMHSPPCSLPLFTPPALPSPPPLYPPPLVQGSQVSLRATLTSLTVHVEDPSRNVLLSASLATSHVHFEQVDGALRLMTSIGNLVVEDKITPSTLYKEVLGLQDKGEGSFIALQFSSDLAALPLGPAGVWADGFPAAPAGPPGGGRAPRFSQALRVSMRSIRLVYVHELVLRVLDVWDAGGGGLRMRAGDAGTGAAPKPEQAPQAQAAKLLALEIDVSSPTVFVPMGCRNREGLAVDLGRIQVSNTLTACSPDWAQRYVLNVLSMQLYVKMPEAAAAPPGAATAAPRGAAAAAPPAAAATTAPADATDNGQPPVENILDDWCVSAVVLQQLPSEPLPDRRRGVPAVDAQVDADEVALRLSASQYRVLLAILRYNFGVMLLSGSPPSARDPAPEAAAPAPTPRVFGGPTALGIHRRLRLSLSGVTGLVYDDTAQASVVSFALLTTDVEYLELEHGGRSLALTLADVQVIDERPECLPYFNKIVSGVPSGVGEPMLRVTYSQPEPVATQKVPSTPAFRASSLPLNPASLSPVLGPLPLSLPASSASASAPPTPLQSHSQNQDWPYLGCSTCNPRTSAQVRTSARMSETQLPRLRPTVQI